MSSQAMSGNGTRRMRSSRGLSPEMFPSPAILSQKISKAQKALFFHQDMLLPGLGATSLWKKMLYHLEFRPGMWSPKIKSKALQSAEGNKLRANDAHTACQSVEAVSLRVDIGRLGQVHVSAPWFIKKRADYRGFIGLAQNEKPRLLLTFRRVKRNRGCS